MTHGHGDHYGGVNYLVGKYHPAVVMSDPDWKMTATQLEFETPLWDPPPNFVPGRDVAAKDGDTLTLGGTTTQLRKLGRLIVAEADRAAGTLAR